MKRKPIYNPITNSLLVLLFAQSFNDWWSVTVGLPTPVQLALFGTVWYNSRFLFSKRNFDGSVKKIRFFLRTYLFVILIYWLLEVAKGLFNLKGVSTLINLTWLITAIPLLNRGFSNDDWTKFKKYATYIVGLITIPTGFYEFITHSNIIDGNVGGLAENLFYLRGLHIDKLEFGAFLSLGAFIGLSSFLYRTPDQTKFNMLVNLYLVFSSGILIMFSFSSTSILGLAVGVTTLLMGTAGRKYLIPVVVIILPIVLIVKSNSMYSNISAAYDLKYTESVTNAESTNFRYLAFNAAIEEFLNEPFFGHGMEQSAKIMNQKLRLGKDINTHNFFGNELLDYGLLGTVPIAMLLFFVYKIALLRQYKVKEKKHYSSSLRAVSIALSMFMLFRFALYYHEFNQSLYLVWVSLAILQYATIKNTYLNENSSLRKSVRPWGGRTAGMQVSGPVQ